MSISGNKTDAPTMEPKRAPAASGTRLENASSASGKVDRFHLAIISSFNLRPIIEIRAQDQVGTDEKFQGDPMQPGCRAKSFADRFFMLKPNSKCNEWTPIHGLRSRFQSGYGK